LQSFTLFVNQMPNADVAKLVDALLSGGSALGCEGSNPFIRTLEESRPLSLLFLCFLNSNSDKLTWHQPS
jgi:hypothetical protein